MTETGIELIWDRLALYGAPLTAFEALDEVPRSERLPEVVAAAIASIEADPDQADAARKREALQHFIFAIGHYFPTRFASLSEEVRDLDTWMPVEITGRLIKHKRISARLLLRYL